MRSPAEPASSFEFSAALYSVGAEGVKLSLMPGWLASKAGMICLLPDREVVVAPALDRQRDVLGEGAGPASSVVPSSAPFSGVGLIGFLPVRWGGRPGSPAGLERVQGRPDMSAARGEQRSAAARSRAPAAISTAGLTAPPVVSSAARAAGSSVAGDGGDDAGGAVAQLDVGGDDVDHVAVVHVPEPDAGQRRDQVERDLLGGGGAEPGRAGDDLRAGVEQDRRRRRARAAG